MQGIKTRATISAGAVPQQSTASAQASKMLEAALQQMDGIISGATAVGAANCSSGNGSVNVSLVGDQSSAKGSGSTGGNSGNSSQSNATLALSERNLISASNVLSTAQTLALALQQVGLAAPAPDPITAAIISDWLETHIPRRDTDEQLRRLQHDKENLTQQYQLLADRFSEQSNKIVELEGVLVEKAQQLSAKEELLQRQMLSRSTLETQKLELMSALSELKLHRAALERENVELKGVELPAQHQLLPQPESGGIVRRLPFGSVGNLNHVSGSVGGGGSYGHTGASPKTPPASLRHQIHPQFHSLPRTHASKSAGHAGRTNINNNNHNNNNNNRSFDANANGRQRNVAFASNEKILIEDNMGGTSASGGVGGNDPMYGSFISQSNSSPSPNLRERSAKGLRQIFGKLRRSNSGNLELPTLEQVEPEFKRGGARATAGGRIEWTTQSSQLSTSSKDYADWSPQEVCNWLCDLGLGCYEDDCRKWLKSNAGVCFFTASPVDIEKELNIKQPLHRKKILLAMDELTGKEDDALALKAAQLDISWVMRWLDDIGLPQYKDTFLLAKMDGRMLHRLTMEDLGQLHVNSCLHIASLRRAIQCMRQMDWNPECLIRRSTRPTVSSPTARKLSSDDGNDSGSAEALPESSGESSSDREMIALWTAHRVMEWLRVADLSEYAPNLRGAGVHGALMLYESRFNAALLADLLSIPPSKTLLRRHLATHFKELLGRDIIQTKRDAEAAPGYQTLTITAKIKPPKKTQFSLKRRKSTKGAGTDIEWTDYVCPLSLAAINATINTSTNANTSVGGSGEQHNSSSTTSSSTSTNNSNSLTLN